MTDIKSVNDVKENKLILTRDITEVEKHFIEYQSLPAAKSVVGQWIQIHFDSIWDIIEDNHRSLLNEQQRNNERLHITFQYDTSRNFLYNFQVLLNTMKIIYNLDIGMNQPPFPPISVIDYLNDIKKYMNQLQAVGPLTPNEQDMLTGILTRQTLVVNNDNKEQAHLVGLILPDDSEETYLNTTIKVFSVLPFLDGRGVRLIGTTPVRYFRYISELAKPDNSLFMFPLVLANITSSYVGGYWIDESGVPIHYNFYKSYDYAIDGNYLVPRKSKDTYPTIPLGELKTLDSRSSYIHHKL